MKGWIELGLKVATWAVCTAAITYLMTRVHPVPVLLVVPATPYSLGDVCAEPPVCRCGESL